MVEFSAVYFDGKSSARKKVRVRGGPGILYVTGEGVRLEFALSQLTVDAPMDVPQRRIGLPGGGQLQTTDHAALAALFPESHVFEKGVHAMERRWVTVLVALVILAGFTGWAVVDGLPLAAKLAAGWIPPRVEAELGERALQSIDSAYCNPSALPAARQAALRRDFERAAQDLGPGFSPRLALRRCGKIGANAFALPGGTVVLTDELVKLAQNDEQVLSVLAHELGHVRNRHSLRLALQSAGAAALVAVLFGDAVSLTSIAVALPTMLLQAGYSRDLEREADDYALMRLKAIGIAPREFASMLELLERQRHPGKDLPAGEVPGYLSTHPATSERIQRILSGS